MFMLSVHIESFRNQTPNHPPTLTQFEMIMIENEYTTHFAHLTFVSFSNHFGKVDGQIFSFFVMVVAAAEAAVGLAIILMVFRNRATLQIDDFDTLKN